MKYSMVPLVLVCYIITLIVASEAPNGHVRRAYNEAELINPDNSTIKVETIHFLRCLHNNNITKLTGPGSIFAYVHGRCLGLAVETNDEDAKNLIERIAFQCYRAVDYDDGFSIEFTLSWIQEGTQLLPLEEAIRTENRNAFSSVRRPNPMIESNGMNQFAFAGYGSGNQLS